MQATTKARLDLIRIRTDRSLSLIERLLGRNAEWLRIARMNGQISYDEWDTEEACTEQRLTLALDYHAALDALYHPAFEQDARR